MSTLSEKEIKVLDKYFRLTNYLSLGMLYLKDNPLLKRDIEIDDIKKKLVGHWGSAPGQNFIYTHLDRIIKKNNLDMIYISGPGHSGQVQLVASFLEGSYNLIHKDIDFSEEGIKKLFKSFSFPGGTSSHAAPSVPGSIHEGGELGYSLSHAFGAVLDNPNLIVACVVGDGEAETGPLATSWHGNKFINPKKDGIVLPILHLNGYKIANPTVFARISDEERIKFFEGCGWDPIVVDVVDKDNYHEIMANAMDEVVEKINKIKKDANSKKEFVRPRYPMIIFKSKKGWTCPKVVNKLQVEDSFRAHQVPINYNDIKKDISLLNEWFKSYKPDELFNSDGSIDKEILEFLPPVSKRMSFSKYANGGLLLKNIKVPDFTNYKVSVNRGITKCEDMKELGKYLKDIMILNKNNFKIFGPDEALSNRLNYVFNKEKRRFDASIYPSDELLSNDGNVFDSYLSEHMCEGMLEGYLLTGRHGLMHSYEAFIRIVDSMASQHAKWLKVSKELPWRRPIASLNYVLSSHVWQQDHNGYTHQDPGFLNHLVTKKADTVRIYLPPDANCLLSCFDHCIKSKNYINVIVASKHPRPQWLTMEEAVIHCTKGLGIWKFASNDEGCEPDIVMACCGEGPTLETLAAIKILRENFKDLKIRMVNVVDLMKLQSHDKHPHGLTDEDYDAIFTKDKPIIFNFHGYPNLIHELTYKRTNKDIHVHGYMEEGTITTPFDMRVQNSIDRFSLVEAAIKCLPQLGNKGSSLIQYCQDKKVEHKEYIKEYGIDMDEIINWKW